MRPIDSAREKTGMRLPRASGVLLHPTSLPGPCGIGDLGADARRFIEFLAETGQRWWQILPLGPTGYGNSPYQSPSSFAGNPLLIDPAYLVEHGWLRAAEIDDQRTFRGDLVDFDRVGQTKSGWFNLAFDRFKASRANADVRFEEFRTRNRRWLEEYALFAALKDAHGGLPWYDWEPKIAARDAAEVARCREVFEDRILFHEFLQFVFEDQWQRLREFGRQRGVMVIGDLPIFVAHDSACVWANPELFFLDEQGRPLVVAGVPPDYFSETGQLWGNPLYRWDVHAADDYSWWLDRLRFLLGRVDMIRIDHFRGFAAYWEIPAGSETAVSGRWVPGPGEAFFESMRRRLGSLPLIAEDLGVITPDVEALRDDLDLPGMRVLQFGFGADPGADMYLPHHYVHHCLAYTGTHDNDTTVGWLTSTEVATTQSQAEIDAERAFVRRYIGRSNDEIHWAMIRLAIASVADTAIVPMQDILGLGSRARMNMPGRAEGNWTWRFQRAELGAAAREKLAELTAVYHRWNGPIPSKLDPRFRPHRAPAAAAAERDGTASAQTAP
jgi:4-alpha-glucanotransferase